MLWRSILLSALLLAIDWSSNPVDLAAINNVSFVTIKRCIRLSMAVLIVNRCKFTMC